MKTTLKRWLLALVFTGALAATALSNYGHEWRMMIRYAPDFLSGFAGGAAIVAAFVLPLAWACLRIQRLNDLLLGREKAND